MPFRGVLLEHSRERLKGFLKGIDSVAESEFPYDQSKNSLDELRKIFRNKLNIINQLDSGSDPTTVRQECAEVSKALLVYLPMLGVILRSTQVRNAFEVYSPLLRMARSILDVTPATCPATQLVLSSGWEYSPYIFPEVPDLPGYALLEFPAPESANPLLLPLAGHELGHSIWIRYDLGSKYWTQGGDETLNILDRRLTEFKTVFRLDRNIHDIDIRTDTNIMNLYEQAELWLSYQAEESFCDFVGLRIFGLSYLDALAYLLAPKLLSTRSEYYPNNAVRAANLLTAALDYGLNPDADYAALFDNDVEPGYTASDTFLLNVADEALRAIIPSLITESRNIIDATGIVPPDEKRINEIVDHYRIGVPASNTNGLADIINAAWRAYRLEDLWSDLPAKGRKKDEVLKDLVLKNIEIWEIEQKQKDPTP